MKINVIKLEMIVVMTLIFLLLMTTKKCERSVECTMDMNQHLSMLIFMRHVKD